jgi:hypothetical protein
MKVQGGETSVCFQNLLKLLEHPCTTKINLRLSQKKLKSLKKKKRKRKRGKKA